MSYSKPKGSILMIDNQDSFTYNLVNDLSELGYELAVYRNTVALEVITDKLRELNEQGPVLIVLSPGPGYPSDSELLSPLIQHGLGRYPILGICLGFQALVEEFGGTINRCYETVHGKASELQHKQHPVFQGIGSKLSVARYHSLMASSVSAEVNVIASYRDIPMAIEHKSLSCIGFQFHPESILTFDGHQLLAQSIEYLIQNFTAKVTV